MSQIITNAFANYLQACLTSQTPVVLDEFVLANIPNLDPSKPISPDQGLPPANQIVHRRAVDQRGRINNDAVAYTIVMDTTVGDFSFNALYLINKAAGVVGMIVHKGLETKLKTNEATGQTGNSLVKSMLMEYDRAPEATATHVDASTWQIDYAARLRGMDDDLRLQALQFFGPATFYGNGFNLVNESGVYKVQPGVAYVGGLRAQLDEVKKVTPGAKPVGLWLDIYRAGSLLDAWVNHFTLTLSVPDLVDYRDANGHQHHVAKVAIINANGSVTDVRRKRTIELTGDVTGKGILEDAQGVSIAVEIKDGSHRHKWGELDQVPATASRWPSWAEVTSKPDLAVANHTHPGSWLNPINLSTEDLDTLKEPKVYAQHANANTSAARHYPENSAGALIVSSGAGPQQTYLVYNSSRVWRRAQYSTGAWTPWTRDYNTGNKPTLAELGAAAASHAHPWSQITGVPVHATRWPTWAEVSSKPTTMPPAAHTHPWAQITGAPVTATRWPAWGEVSGKPATMPPAAHTHTAAQGNADIVASGWGQVGSYAMACCIAYVGAKTAGYVIAGSNLKLACGSDQWAGRGATLPGTWKLLGYIVGDGKDGGWNNSTWIRIS
ncbi:phage tail protein [Aeromonas salmonicida]|uniref:phage tail-collar fiber domain-containing protein n=1 Tax=Aeromonas salmonicida TaxID=645 RepID=UPI0038D45B4C